MKVRLDFVTNSSSSSFIIAKHKDFKIEELEKLLAKDIEIFAKNCLTYYDDEDDYQFKGCKTKKQKIDKVIKDVLSGFKSLGGDMMISDWTISSVRACSYSDNFFSAFLYNNCGSINTDTIKISLGNE